MESQCVMNKPTSARAKWISDEEMHRQALKNHLTLDQLLLCDRQRERILIEKELIDSGVLHPMDMGHNSDKLERVATKRAYHRNQFELSDWFDSLSRGQKWFLVVCVVAAVWVIRTFSFKEPLP